MEDILYPSKIELTPGASQHEAILVAEPFFHGYGTTVGNALRRALLSSLSGAAITAVRIKGGQHEFSALPHVKEDVLEIILNLKQVRLKSYADAPVKLTLRANGEKEVTAADIKATSDVEIANPNCHIATLTDKSAEFEMEITVERGRGYVPTEERSKEKMELGTIAIDALFTPVVSVGFRVENVRVGDITNYDKLIMTIETDGTVSPKEAVEHATGVLINHFQLFQHVGGGTGAAPIAASDSLDEAVREEASVEKPKKSKKKATESEE
jgi:DNA-directed RNA polymerase subunit alpha